MALLLRVLRLAGFDKHVDGTRFSSPIVASIAAQMIEAHPGLQPLEIKGLLAGTARGRGAD